METLPLQSLERELPDSAWRRLGAYLGNVTVGFDEVLETPFFKGKPHDPQEFGRWYYENIAKSGIPELDSIEEDEIDKFTPFSLRLPWSERREGAAEYFNSPRKEVKVSAKSISRLSRLIPKHSLQPLRLQAAFNAMPKDSNLGLPWFSRDKEFVQDYLERAFLTEARGWIDPIFPAVVGWRGQSSDDPEFPKQRVVWMVDHVETIVGLSIQAPLLERLRSNGMFAAWNSLDVIDLEMTRLIDRAQLPIMSADFSGFDKRLPSGVIFAVFELMRYWFSQSAWARITWLEEQFQTVGLTTPDGIYTGRIGGVPSGSALTNLVDSLGQLLMVLDLVEYASVLGDDGVYTDVVEPDDIVNVLDSRYGMQVSADKGGHSKDEIRFLQRVHLRRYRHHGICVGVRSLVRTWKGACYLERRTPNLPQEFFSARTITQLENAKWHPKFRKAVEYFFNVDSVVRNLDPVEIFHRAGGAGFVEKTLGLDSYRFGKELPSEGLQTFATVSELRRLRGSRGKVT